MPVASSGYSMQLPIESNSVIRYDELITISTPVLMSKTFEIGDIFNNELWPGLYTTCKAWHMNLTVSSMGRREFPHKICFRHNELNGQWVLIIDGYVKAVGTETPLKRYFHISFVLNDKTAVIECDGKRRVMFQYKFTIDDSEIPELNKMVNINLGEKLPMNVCIPDTRTYSDGTKNVTYYQLYVEAGNGDRIMIERRFSEFAMLDTLIRSNTDSHIQSSLPKLPSKYFSPLIDQSSELFIISRRIALERYLTFLLSNQKIVYYSEFLCFLGLDPLTGNPVQPKSPISTPR